MKRTIYFTAALALVSLSGCANFTSVYRELKTSEGTGALIDIKQRAIIASKNDNAPYKVIVCTEPSPDSLSAVAAEVVGKADLPNSFSTQLVGAARESASFTGLRTHSIQLLRDSMYRACEAFMNGAITQNQYDLLARRYQKHAVALLAIEQMTGVARVPPITINTTGSAESGRSLLEMRGKVSLIDAQVSALEKKKADKDTSDEAMKAIVLQLSSFKVDKEAITQSIEKVLVSGSASATVNMFGIPPNSNEKHISEVIQAVKGIVAQIILPDDNKELCFMHIQIDAKLTDAGKELQSYCLEFLKAELKINKETPN